MELEAKKKAFAEEREVQLAREYSSTYQRSLPVGCTAEDAAIMAALAARDGTDCTVAEYKAAFWAHVEEVETKVHAAREQIAAEKREANAKAAAELAAAEAALNESRSKRGDA